MTKKNPFIKPTRRDFLQIVVVSAAAGLVGCGDDADAESGSGSNTSNGTTSNGTMSNGTTGTSNGTTGPVVTVEEAFPQSVASGDPTPSSVILWTRVEPAEPSAEETVEYEIASDEAFTRIIMSGTLAVKAESDHTLRLKVTDLSAYTTYYYRFKARGATSKTGRTKTAPAPDQDVSVRFAFASCQDFNGRYYHAWSLLAEENPQPDFVVFLGDYIYETSGDPRFQETAGDRLVDIPDGLELGDETMMGFKAAKTLRDYRGLYKQYRSDKNLQRAHELYPFVIIWDDHEFADDCWQDHSTHFGEEMGDEKDTQRRTDASQAWFEFQPADIERDGSAMFPNDMSIYRSLTYGKHIEVVLTDQRSYRSDHVIPEGPPDLDVGKFTPNSGVGSRQFLLKSGFDPKEEAAAPTMLGEEQRMWLVDALTTSQATWKFWGSETQLAQSLVDLSSFETVPENFRDVFYLTVDQWDGYRTERAAILEELAGIENLVVLTGDIHAFYGSELHTDFDNLGEPMAVEYVVSGISSSSIQQIVQRVVESNTTLSALGLGELVPRFDELLQEASPHYKYAHSNRNGIALVDVTAEAIEVTFIQLEDVTKPEAPNASSVSRVRLRTAAGSNRVEVV